MNKKDFLTLIESNIKFTKRMLFVNYVAIVINFSFAIVAMFGLVNSSDHWLYFLFFLSSSLLFVGVGVKVFEIKGETKKALSMFENVKKQVMLMEEETKFNDNI